MQAIVKHFALQSLDNGLRYAILSWKGELMEDKFAQERLKVTSFRFHPEIYALLERLARTMSMSKIAVVTVALRELAKREGVE